MLSGWGDHHRAVALDEIHEFLMFLLRGTQEAQGSANLERHHIEVMLAHIKVRVRVPHVAAGVTFRPPVCSIVQAVTKNLNPACR